MKKIIYFLILLSLASCKKEMMGYDGVEGIYFAVTSGPSYASPSSWPYRPYTNIEFVKQPASVKEYIANIKVMITGPVKDYDRQFTVEINPDSTTAQEGVHFLPIGETFIIPASAIYGYIPVTLKRTPDLAVANKKVGLRLIASEDFGIVFTNWKAIPGLGTNNLGPDTAFDASLHTINVSDLMVQPAVWRGSVVTATNKETGAWGAFTRKKLLLMCQLFNLTYEDFGSDATMPLVLSNLITTEMTRYLVNQFNAGTPVKEDDGRLMWVGTVPWTSIVGVPY
ncbi:DUF4843 domain-containing protein [Niastella caeni]|uniref:DUF4843 domain-containing protein n=1 Tax=Niastella caeni TaxID=2569763 RepID=A0A4S8HS48_9BACT|nr:DUF4843 domain-containing protein [Niastella caeni]THU38357.1 DUF4843 domain-containing protein [Niastella caeni]